jgi:hypothetical protein
MFIKYVILTRHFHDCGVDCYHRDLQYIYIYIYVLHVGLIPQRGYTSL